MKTVPVVQRTESAFNLLAAKLRLKQYKVERLRGTLRLLEAECERLERQIRRRRS